MLVLCVQEAFFWHHFQLLVDIDFEAIAVAFVPKLSFDLLAQATMDFLQICQSLALPAGGAATCWILLTSLWLPYLNQSRSMAELGQQLQLSLPPNACVIEWNLTNEQISTLYYYGKVSHLTSATDISSEQKCSLLLANVNALQLNASAIDPSIWSQTERLPGNRLNSDDDLIIFHRR